MNTSALQRPETRPRALGAAVGALRHWRARQITVAAAAALLVALTIGIATALIPNPIFGRDIPPTWWSYPVWLLTSALTGLLIATYVAPTGRPAPAKDRGRLGVAGGLLTWFAVGCPVCNKIALLALGYAGAVSWFAPLQPLLAVAALVLTSVALVARLRGQVECPVRPSGTADAVGATDAGVVR
ncbi:Cytochrome c-type biogenesis protein CcdA (DsbD analog) [Actinomycetales bacterium JB111]|nr:Cytochrome c-type biogenesis protein CcdA (DsbD analog) [Actinomycetales bacterium JB111]